MIGSESGASRSWRVIVVGGHTRSIGKTQLVCDLIRAFPEAGWIAGKITQYGHGVCARNGENCDCAPAEHSAALDWESRSDTGTDTARFLAAGASRALWLRTKQGYLAEGLPLLRAALWELEVSRGQASGNLILESNSLLQFLKPALYLVVLAPLQEDFKESARMALNRADAFVLRSSLEPKLRLTLDLSDLAPWSGVSSRLLHAKPSYIQREGQTLPEGLKTFIRGRLEHAQAIPI